LPPEVPIKPNSSIIALSLAVIVTAAVSLIAQGVPAKKPSFEVASIKPSTVLPVPAEILQQISFSISGRLKGGRLVAQGVTVRGLMRAAYAPVSADSNPLLEGQIVGGPAWIGTDLFDIEAKAESSAIRPEEAKLMLQSLLEDRFHLKYHRAERELPVLSLVVAKGGHKVKLSDDQTPAVIDPAKLPGPSEGRRRGGDGFSVVERPRGLFGSSTKFTGDTGNRTMAITFSGTGVPISRLVFVLEDMLRRPVINKTGLKGLFDIAFTVEGLALAGADPVTSDPLPHYAPALEKQLGLKLEPVKGPLEVIVIDSISTPSAN
jgi:uncharacterized protein (TIGR03435 family)